MLMRPWTISKLWPGQTVFIIGGGPSLIEQDLTPIHNRRVIGVNDAFKLGDWVDVCWWSDCRWGVWNQTKLAQFQGLNVSCTRCNCEHTNTLQVRRQHAMGISTNPEEINWNRNSGASAINLAYHLGARRVVLLGFDMKVQNGEHNWHQNHQFKPRPGVYEERFLPVFEHIKQDADRLGLDIINSTPDSALTLFPYVELEGVL